MDFILHTFIKILSFSVIRYFLIAGAFFLFFYKFFPKSFASNKIQANHAKSSTILNEVVNSLFTTIVLSTIGLLIFHTDFKSQTLIYTDIRFHSKLWFFMSVLLALVIHDTYFYWMHYLLHHPKIFKYTHLEHHKSNNPSPFASYSFHIIEAFFEGAVLLLIVLLIPIHPFAIILFVLIGFVINVYGHLGHEIAPLWLRHTWLFQIFNTSVYHNLHHSKFKGNYGLYFRFWDRIMGTEHPGYIQLYDKIQLQREQNKMANSLRKQQSKIS
ncbi:sterol desaturase family protein [Pedobacter sandarakinus]|uniref:sterol desaturase family protein n=1 Tax=Pedobacter sandarakinus TaxID=353156 RepID=UPI00224778DF|nr:sterol desaturase family protein [Pedobacter sandarakinus]MCX2574107.1 sterol desaturase family protein [Pedobacter sandarakinus]